MAKSEQPEGFKHRVPSDRRIKDKCAIVGFTDHRVLAFALPRDEWEVWGINELHKVHDVALFDRWFEVHQRKDLDTDAPHVEALGKMDIPVYMQQHHPDIAPSVAFPRDELKKFSVEKLGRVYFTSSIAWELALAIKMGFKEIHIYGVDMAQDSEYARERNCCEAWLGVAAGAGIKIYLPPTSDLLKCIGEYGFGDEGTEFSLKVKERKAWLHGQDNDFLAQVRAIDAKAHEIRAQLHAERKQKLTDVKREYRAKIESFEAEYQQKRGPLWDQRNQCHGAIMDCEFWDRSWAVQASPDRTFSPDRSKDPRTGIKPQVPASDGNAPADVDALGVSPKNRVTAEQAA